MRRKWQPTPVLLPGESHGGRSLVGYSPWGHKELDTTEWLHFHFQPPRPWATPAIWSSSAPIAKKGRWKVKAWGQVSCWAHILARGVNNTPSYQSYLLLPPKLTQSLWPGALARASSQLPALALILLLSGKFHGQRSLVGYSPWGHKELDMTEGLRLHLL